jgi:hypothetical protein
MEKKYGLFGKGTAFLGPEIRDAEIKICRLEEDIGNTPDINWRGRNLLYPLQIEAYKDWVDLKMHMLTRAVIFILAESMIGWTAWTVFVK